MCGSGERMSLLVSLAGATQVGNALVTIVGGRFGGDGGF